MAAGELNAGLSWISWLAVGVPALILLAVAALVRRGSRLKAVSSAIAPDTDLRQIRFDEARMRPRQRRAAVVEKSANDSNMLMITRPAVRLAAISEPAGGTRRPGLTTRWKGDHRIAIHR